MLLLWEQRELKLRGRLASVSAGPAEAARLSLRSLHGHPGEQPGPCAPHPPVRAHLGKPARQPLSKAVMRGASRRVATAPAVPALGEPRDWPSAWFGVKQSISSFWP